MTSDEIFWERLLEMPDIEAEQELVARRLIVIRESAELGAFRAGRFGADAIEAGVLIANNSLQLSLLNEHIKLIRKRMDRAGRAGLTSCRRRGASPHQINVWCARPRRGVEPPPCLTP